MEFSKLYGELKTLEAALCALRKCETRLSITLKWITRFHGKVPEGLKEELKAADALPSIRKSNQPQKPGPTRLEFNGPTLDFGNLDESANDDTYFGDSPTPQTEESDEKPDINALLQVDANPNPFKPNDSPTELVETTSGFVKIVDIRKITEPDRDNYDTDDEVKVEGVFHNCVHCSATFPSLHQLSVHALVHTKLQLSRMGISKESLDLVVHQPKTYSIRRLKDKLVVCKKTDNPVPKNLVQWKKKTLDRSSKHGKIQCQYCPQSFMCENGLSQHLSHTHHHPSPCELCNMRFTTRKELNNHVRTIHPEHECYKCKVCEKTFLTEVRLNNHMSLVHPHPSLARTCNICGKTIKSKAQLHVHVAKCHPDPSLAVTCDICGVVCRTTSNLKQHKLGVHVERKFLCQTCGLAVKTQAALNTHMSRHKNIRAYKCTQCPQDFKSGHALSRHMSRHLGKEGKKCPYCGIFKSEMYNHITIVHKGRKFKCAQCPSMFSLRAHLKNHYVLKHSDVPMPADSEFEVVFTGPLGRNGAENPETMQQDVPEPAPPKKKPKMTRTSKSVYRSRDAPALSCSICGEDAVFSSRDDFELHMRRHEKNPEYKLKHRLPVKRLVEAQPTEAEQTNIDTTLIQDNADQQISEHIPVPLISPPLLQPANELHQLIEDMPLFNSYMNL